MIPGKLITFILALSFFSVPLVAQQLDWENYTNKETVASLASFAGYVWAATTGGVVRLDPDNDSVFTYMNSDGLGSTSIKFAAPLGDSVAFFGSTDGVLSRLRIKTGEFTFEKLQGREGTAISLNSAVVSGDFLWIASSVGIIKYDLIRHGGEVKETYRNLGDFPAETAVRDLVVSDGQIIAVTATGLAVADAANEFLLDPNEWTTISTVAALNCLVIYDGVYVGANTGLYQLLPGPILQSVGLSDANVLDLATATGNTELFALFNRSGTRGILAYTADQELPLAGDADALKSMVALTSNRGLVVGTSGLGIYGVTNNELQSIEVPGPASNDLVGGGYTATGLLRVIARNGTLSTLSDGDWKRQTITSEEQLAGLVDRDDNVWICTFGSGVFRLNPVNELTNFTYSNSPLIGIQQDATASVVNGLYQDPAGRIWFSLFQGNPHRPMVVFDPSDSAWTWFDAADGFVVGNNQVIAAGVGTAAVGVDDQGIAFLRFGSDLFNHADDQLGYFSRSRRLPSAIVTALTYDRDNRLWVGTNQGLARFDDDIEFFIPASLPAEVNSEITALAVDSRNNLWVGTTGGLALMPEGGGDTLAFTTANSELVADQIESLVYDEPSGRLLIFTRNGLSILDYSLVDGDASSGVVAYPNPFRIGDGALAQLQFRLDQRGDVRIFTVAGDLVRLTDVNTGWDGRNAAGEFVASGVYIWEIKAEDGSRHLGKVFVVRR